MDTAALDIRVIISVTMTVHHHYGRGPPRDLGPPSSSWIAIMIVDRTMIVDGTMIVDRTMIVIPAKAGIQNCGLLSPGFRLSPG